MAMESWGKALWDQGKLIGAHADEAVDFSQTIRDCLKSYAKIEMEFANASRYLNLKYYPVTHFFKRLMATLNEYFYSYLCCLILPSNIFIYYDVVL